MPSPFGHALAGAAIGFAALPSLDPPQPPVSSVNIWRVPALCAAIAALPDADLLVSGFHRGPTHSLTATALVLIVTAAVTGQVTGKVHWRLALACALAHASHPLMDWLGTDYFRLRGVELFWPFSSRFYISDWDIFPETERRLRGNPRAFAINLRAFLAELGLVGPLVLAAWWRATRTRRSLVPTSDQGIPPRPSA